jgi:N-acetylglucosamine-6-phosphate deacetylase
MIFTNGRLIFPDGIRDAMELVVRDGKIAEVREAWHGHPAGESSGGTPEPQDIVDLEGNYLAPGFVDLHLHGALGRDTMEASEEGFHTICDFHASGGTTSVLLTTATAPLNAIVDVLAAVRHCRSSIKQIAGVHVEGPFISKTKRGAQREEFIQDPTPKSVGRLLEFADLIKRITIAPELPGAIAAVDQFRKNGISVSGGHSEAWDKDARAAFARGMRSVTHTFNCMSSARRNGVYREAGLLEFALSESEVLCELIADGHHVSTTLMKMLYRAKGARAICLVTDATAGAGLPNESRFSLFGRDCVVHDGVCLLADGSALAGSAARMVDLVRTMVKDVDLPLHEAIAMATENPARAIGLETKGRLVTGADADLVVLSPKLEVVQTFTGGEGIFTGTGSSENLTV